MKKLILILSVLSINCFSQNTMKSINVDVANKIIRTEYINPLGQIKIITYSAAPFTGTDSTRYKNFIKINQDRLDTITTPAAKMAAIIFATNNSFGNGIFVVTGEYFPPKLVKVGQLAGADLTLVNNFNSFVTSYTGGALTSLNTDPNTDVIYINNIVYSAATIETASGGLLSQLKTFCSQKFNQ